MADAITTLIAELRDYKQSENAQRIRATVETMVAAFQQTEAAIGAIGPGFAYSTGLWTPVDASGDNLVFSAVDARFTLIGNICNARAIFSYPVTASATLNLVGGLPFPIANFPSAFTPSYAWFRPPGGNAGNIVMAAHGVVGTSTFQFTENTLLATAVANSVLSNSQMAVNLMYPIS